MSQTVSDVIQNLTQYAQDTVGLAHGQYQAQHDAFESSLNAYTQRVVIALTHEESCVANARNLSVALESELQQAYNQHPFVSQQYDAQTAVGAWLRDSERSAHDQSAQASAHANRLEQRLQETTLNCASAESLASSLRTTVANVEFTANNERPTQRAIA